MQFCREQRRRPPRLVRVGTGPPIVKTGNWLNHIEYDWESPVWSHVLHWLASGRTLIRYDARGNGLSDWDVPEISFDAFVRDLEAVVDAAGLDRFALFGASQGCAFSIAYAVKYPDRVSKLVLYGGFARGRRLRGSAVDREQAEAMLTLMRTGWGQDNPAFRQFFTSLFVPGGTAEQMEWFNELQRKTTSPENAVKLRLVSDYMDIVALLPRVRTPDAGAALPRRRGAALRGGPVPRRRHSRRPLRRPRGTQPSDPRGRPGLAEVPTGDRELPRRVTEFASRRASWPAPEGNLEGSGVPKVGAPEFMSIEATNAPKITGQLGSVFRVTVDRAMIATRLTASPLTPRRFGQSPAGTSAAHNTRGRGLGLRWCSLHKTNGRAAPSLAPPISAAPSPLTQPPGPHPRLTRFNPPVHNLPFWTRFTMQRLSWRLDCS